MLELFLSDFVPDGGGNRAAVSHFDNVYGDRGASVMRGEDGIRPSLGGGGV